MKARATPPLPKLSGEFARLAELCAGETVTFRALAGEMRPRDHAVLTLLLCAAFLHPVPMLGLSFPLGSMILIAGMRMALGKGPWVPARWIDKPLRAGIFRAVFGAFGRLLKFVEVLVRPRGKFLTAHPWTRRANGLGLALVGAFIMTPLPPPTNFPPALAGFLLSAGILEDDLAVLVLAWVCLALNVVLFGAIAVYGLDAVVFVWKRCF